MSMGPTAYERGWMDGNAAARSGEMEMHYQECLDWVQALEWFIREHGLEVPTWASVEAAGWKPTRPADLT